MIMSGCVSPQDRPLSQTCDVLAVYEGPPHIPVERDDRDTAPDGFWSATAVVVKTASGSAGMLVPATLFLLARPGKTELTANDVVNYSRLAFSVRDDNIRGRWITADTRTFFILAFDCGGTAGNRIVVFVHGTMYSGGDPMIQEHYFFEVLDEHSRLPILLADVDGDGIPELLIATEETNGSNTSLESNPKMYRVFTIADELRWPYVIKEIHQADAHELKNVEEF